MTNAEMLEIARRHKHRGRAGYNEDDTVAAISEAVALQRERDAQIAHEHACFACAAAIREAPCG